MFGLKPVVGDLVLIEQSEDTTEHQTVVETNDDKTEGDENNGTKKGK